MDESVPSSNSKSIIFRLAHFLAALLAIVSLAVLGYILILLVLGPKNNHPVGILHLTPLEQSTDSAQRLK